jgi:hypothetical protein
MRNKPTARLLHLPHVPVPQPHAPMPQPHAQPGAPGRPDATQRHIRYSSPACTPAIDHLCRSPAYYYQQMAVELVSISAKPCERVDYQGDSVVSIRTKKRRRSPHYHPCKTTDAAGLFSVRLARPNYLLYCVVYKTNDILHDQLITCLHD